MNLPNNNSQTFQHIPVLLNEILEATPLSCFSILDCTLGGGGHSYALLQKHENALLTAFDRDKEALNAATIKLKEFSNQCTFHHSEFSKIDSYIENKKFDFILADIGVSSRQFDSPERGFSFSKDGPLDMRMNAHEETKTASSIVNQSPEKELQIIFKKYGEERFAKKIAKAIVNTRNQTPFVRTQQLADFIASHIPKKFQKPRIHPATKIFQALRIVVNQELKELSLLLQSSIKHLSPKGKIAIISFHSLEDRIVKHQFQKWQNPCECSPELPYCICNLKALGKISPKSIIEATENEKRINPRSRSAKLRIFECF